MFRQGVKWAELEEWEREQFMKLETVRTAVDPSYQVTIQLILVNKDGYPTMGVNTEFGAYSIEAEASYKKFIAIVREKNIPFGYIGSRNIDSVVAQVYQEMGR